jgi:hypothetical protein
VADLLPAQEHGGVLLFIRVGWGGCGGAFPRVRVGGADRDGQRKKRAKDKPGKYKPMEVAVVLHLFIVPC